MTTKEFLLKLSNKDDIILCSLGQISKIAEELKIKNRILVRGGMGSVLGIGLGLALNVENKVKVIIGDGAFLMKMGSMATILRYRPKNLQIIILNNNCHQSCGGQPTNFRFLKKYVPFKVVEINEKIDTKQNTDSTQSHIRICYEIS